MQFLITDSFCDQIRLTLCKSPKREIPKIFWLNSSFMPITPKNHSQNTWKKCLDDFKILVGSNVFPKPFGLRKVKWMQRRKGFNQTRLPVNTVVVCCCFLQFQRKQYKWRVKEKYPYMCTRAQLQQMLRISRGREIGTHFFSLMIEKICVSSSNHKHTTNMLWLWMRRGEKRKALRVYFWNVSEAYSIEEESGELINVKLSK